MQKLLFGTAGIPIGCSGNTIDGIRHVREIGLDAMELEFVRSVNISVDRAPVVRKAAEENNVALTCHAPYYINLNAAEKAKREASAERLLRAARIAWLCGAQSVAFHPGFYMGRDKEHVYETVMHILKEISRTLGDEGNEIWIRPETTGKRTQFGDIDEVIRLSRDIDRVLPCIDYAHLHAREGGVNTYEEFSQVLEKIEKRLGKEALQNMHMQIAGVEYTKAGERRHLPLEESDLNFSGITRSWKDFGIRGVVISESPNIEADALLLKGLHEK